MPVPGAVAILFAVLLAGWGTFSVGVKLMLKDGSTQSMSHQLEFR